MELADLRHIHQGQHERHLRGRRRREPAHRPGEHERRCSLVLITPTALCTCCQAFHGGHWGGWTFAVNASSTGADGGLTLGFEKGGYQEARGSASGAESYIENAKGLLDSPREW